MADNQTGFGLFRQLRMTVWGVRRTQISYSRNLFYYNKPLSSFEQHYKPGSVSDDHLSWLYVTAQLLCPVTRTERDQPGSTTGRRIASYSVLLRVEFTQPCLLPAKRWALTPPFHHHSPQAVSCFFSIALVLESPPPDVIRHPALWSPDFPPFRATVCAAPRYSNIVSFICKFKKCTGKHGINHSADASCISYTLKQLPPINSRIMEFFGTFSQSAPRK